MFEIGEQIIYGSSGVCAVENIGKINLPGVSGDSLYYTLRSCNIKGNTIFTPVDNDKVQMRHIISEQEARELLEEIQDIECFEDKNDRVLEAEYRGGIQKCKCRDLIKIIKTTCCRKEARLLEGKKGTSCDEKYFRMAEDMLYGEMAVAMGMDKEAVRESVIARVRMKEEINS